MLIQEYIVDFSSNNNFFLVKGVQGDSERYVKLSLSNYGQPYTISSDGSVYATIRGTKPDNKEIWNYCDIIDESTIQFQLTPQMLAVAGKSDYEISILRTDSNRVITSFPFFIIVSKSAVDLDYIVSSDEFTVLTDRIYQARVATEECISRTELCVEATEDLRELESEVTTSESVRCSNEEARKETENNRIKNEKERFANENERNLYEILRKKAEHERVDAESNRTIEEDIRNKSEENRQFSENLRSIEEENRVEQENNRIISEDKRNKSESERNIYEILRNDAEHDRKIAESERVIEENIRIDNEEQREIYEYFRKESEKNRVDAEQIRSMNEDNRIDTEDSRKLSEILRTKAENERDIAENIRVNSENLRNEYELERNLSEELRKKREEIRIENENIRINSENIRIASENERIISENLRNDEENIRKGNESERVNSENIRNTSESERNISETLRKDSEQVRVGNENTRIENENVRLSNEENRISEETTRVNSENVRIENENTRINAETTRIENENLRIATEQGRVDAELLRVQAESDRQTNTATAISNAEQATADAITATELANTAANNVTNAIGIDDTQNSTLTTWSSDHINDYVNTNYMKKSNPSGTGSFSMNRKAGFAIGENSVAEGSNCIATGKNSHAEGDATIAFASCSHAEGKGFLKSITISGGANSTTYYVDQTNKDDIAIGMIVTYGSKYVRINDIVDSKITVDETLSSSILTNAHANLYTAASGAWSHVEGYQTHTSGACAHAEGDSCYALGSFSHAEGKCSVVQGYRAHAEGLYTTASGDDQHVQGKYNIEDSESIYAHIVGNGDSTTRSNAHTLDWDGNAEFAGDVIAYGCGGENPISISGLNSNKANKTNPTLTWKINEDTAHEATIELRQSGSAGTNGLSFVRTDASGVMLFNNIFTHDGKIDLNGNAATIKGTNGVTIGSSNGTVAISGKAVKISSNGYVEFLNPVLFENGEYMRFKDTSGKNCVVMGLNSGNNINIGEPQTSQAANGHQGDTVINALAGNIRLRNKTGGVQFEASGSSTYDGYFKPETDNMITLGRSSYRWKKIYAGDATISTSDERLKHDIVAISELPVPFRSDGENILEQLYDKLIPKVYYLNSNSDEEEKLHIGFVAQDISKSLEEIGMSENDLALIDHEYWTDEETKEEKDRYGLAYSQFIALNTYMIQKLRKENEELKNKNYELEERLSKVESMLNIK